MDSIVFLKKVALRFPKPIRILLKYPWNKWCSMIKWDNEIVKYISDYFKVSEKEIKFLLKYGEKLDTFFWNYLKLKNSEEFFYKNTPFYIFELAFWHMTKYQRIFRSKIMEMSKGSILDFGGGIGDLSLAFYKKGFSVTYADVDGETFDFAQCLFLKNNVQVNVINLSEKKIENNYDTIICIDVIEHVPNQKEILDLFLTHLNQKGLLIITNIGFNEMDQEQHENHPMHIPFDFDAKKYLLDNGLVETKYPWAFVKK